MDNKTVVAVHQPNFFPWLGYFDKIARGDVFVCLDDVQLPRTGSGTWVNRVKLLVSGEGRWATAPVKRGHGLQTILEAEFDDSPWRRKLLGTLDSSYRKAPFFKETMAYLEPLVSNPEQSVANYNLNAVTVIARELGLDTSRIVRSSTIETEEASTALLIALTKKVGGDAYLCGGGATGYQEDELFAASGLGLIEQNFAHPQYPQAGHSGDFVPGLSVIDALMNLGTAGTRALLAPEAKA